MKGVVCGLWPVGQVAERDNFKGRALSIGLGLFGLGGALENASLRLMKPERASITAGSS